MREAATICPRPLQVDLWPFDLESGVRVTCDVDYLCANFSLPKPLCSRLRPDVRNRQRQTDVWQTDVRRASSLNDPYPRGGGGIINVAAKPQFIHMSTSPQKVTHRHHHPSFSSQSLKCTVYSCSVRRYVLRDWETWPVKMIRNCAAADKTALTS